MMCLLGRFQAASLTILTGPVIIWKVQSNTDEMLAPAKIASSAFEVDRYEELTKVTAFWMFDAERSLTESSKSKILKGNFFSEKYHWKLLRNDVSELGLYSLPFSFVTSLSLKNLESVFSTSLAVIVSGSLVSSIVEQNHFRALKSDFVFLTVMLDFCAEIKPSSSYLARTRCFQCWSWFTIIRCAFENF